MSDEKVTKTDEEWRSELDAEQYQVTRCSGTERAFTGKYWDEKTAGKQVNGEGICPSASDHLDQ